MAIKKGKSRHQEVSGEMVEAARGLYLRYGGREHVRIEREMRRIGGGDTRLFDNGNLSAAKTLTLHIFVNDRAYRGN